VIYRVEELLWRLPAAADSEMGRLRDQATNALAAARSAIAGNVARAETDLLAAADLDAHVREWPRTALGAAVMFGLAIGLWSGRPGHRRRRRSRRLPEW
jgi:ElaB/YqjD/DUF883 family membrane-anchored ribosome-binding protein